MVIRANKVQYGQSLPWNRRWLGSTLIVWALLLPWRTMAVGTWVALSHTAPSGVGTMLLLSDGSVMAQQSGVRSNWYQLKPDSHGNYASGTWSTLASMHDARLYYSSQVLRDGRVFVAGGEYGILNGNSAIHVADSRTAELYDPLANSWTLLPSSGQDFLDSISEILPNGNVIIAPVFPSTCGGTIIYNPASNTWSAGAALFRGCYQDEASWVKLADDSILTIDPFGINSERYIPSLNLWVDDGVVPVSLYDSFGFELGAALLLPDGRAFFLGSTGHTALYTPSGTTSPGVWTAGPDIPGAHGTPDAPAAMMVNGKILCAVSPVPTSGNHFPTPTSFYEYDPVSNSFTSASKPSGLPNSTPSYNTRMLDLPDGTVLFSYGSSQLYVYQPDGSPLAAGRPTISDIVQNADGSCHLTGTLLNGISEGAAYGDDVQVASGYPIVRLTDVGGTVYFARTYNWDNTSIMTGNTLKTTEFSLPAGQPPGLYSLVVVANGISSDPVAWLVGPSGGFQIISIEQQNDDVLLTWRTMGGTTNVVQVAIGGAGGYTNDFVALSPPIIVIGSGLTSTNYLDVGGATNDPSRFYRVQITPP